MGNNPSSVLQGLAKNGDMVGQGYDGKDDHSDHEDEGTDYIEEDEGDAAAVVDGMGVDIWPLVSADRELDEGDTAPVGDDAETPARQDNEPSSNNDDDGDDDYGNGDDGGEEAESDNDNDRAGDKGDDNGNE
jgi:hypothetical protein